MSDASLSLSPSEIDALANASSEAQWNQLCDQVKAARGGQYPDDWWEKVIQSGLCVRAKARWEGTSVPSNPIPKIDFTSW